MLPTLARRMVAEGVGTALLLAVVVGSGIMGERLAGANVALCLLGNSLATGGGLIALILALGPISGAHFNPVVTVSMAATRALPWREVPVYVGAQVGGAILGVWAAHLMFGEAIVQLSQTARPGAALAWSEVVASFGLMLVIFTAARHRVEALPYAVAAYIVSAYWFTASTSFANPAVTIARALSDTFAGIRPQDVPVFIGAQFIGAAAATLLCHWLLQPAEARSETVARGTGATEPAR